MRFLLGIMIWICVGVGAVSAVTAYFPQTSLDPESFRTDDPEKAGETGYLLLNEADGPEVTIDGETKRRFPAGTELTSAILLEMAEIQPDGKPLVARVHVNEFSWGRWSHKWWFILSVVVLGLCGIGQRMLANGGVVKKGTADPNDSVEAAIAELVAIRESIPSISGDHDRLHTIVERVGELQQTHMANFTEAREVLIARHGLRRYAEIMDVFAGGERKVNRAWSSAADGVLGEAILNLEEAVPLLEEARRRIG